MRKLIAAQAAPHADTTPGDPMDLPASPEYLRAKTSDAPAEIPVPLGSTTAVLPLRQRPGRISLTAGNEWGRSAPREVGPQFPRDVVVGTMAAGFTVPTQVTFGDTIAINGTLNEYLSIYAEELDAGIPVWLQARATTTSAWKTVGRYLGETKNPFPILIDSVGGRQYRLWVPTRKEVTTVAINLTPAASTSARTSTTLAAFRAA